MTLIMERMFLRVLSRERSKEVSEEADGTSIYIVRKLQSTLGQKGGRIRQGLLLASRVLNPSSTIISRRTVVGTGQLPSIDGEMGWQANKSLSHPNWLRTKDTAMT
jgi:hypothetical protein